MNNPPKWLGNMAKRFFRRITEGKSLTYEQRESYALLADSYETYREAQGVFKDFCDQNQTMILGNKIHPAHDVMQSAYQRYIRLGTKLNIFESQPGIEDQFDDISSEVSGL